MFYFNLFVELFCTNILKADFYWPSVPQILLRISDLHLPLCHLQTHDERKAPDTAPLRTKRNALKHGGGAWWR